MADPETRRTHDRTHAGHGSVGSYLLGFGLSAVLTLVGFGAVMVADLTPRTTGWVVVGAGALQICVQNYFFMHMNRASERWNFVSFFFTVLILAILVGGSLWIMTHLSHNLMG